MITNEQLEFDRLLQEHPSEEAWESYALGQVDETQLERMDMHLFVCDSCQATLEDADRFVKALRASSLAQVAPAAESIFDKLHRTLTTLRWTQYPLLAGACAMLAVPEEQQEARGRESGNESSRLAEANVEQQKMHEDLLFARSIAGMCLSACRWPILPIATACRSVCM